MLEKDFEGNVNGKGTDGRSTRGRERKSAKLNLRLSKSDVELLNRLSYEEDEPMSQIVRKAIKRYADGRDKT